MVNSLPIVLSGSALFFAAGMIVKYGKILNGSKSTDEENANRILLYGPKPSDKVTRRWDVASIIQFLEAGKHSIDVCLTKLTNSELAAALIVIHKEGNIQIRVIIHGENAEECRGPLLQENGIDVKKVSATQKLQHNFILVDGHSAETGTAEATVLIGALDSVGAGLAGAGEHHVYDSTIITTAHFVTTTLALEFNRLWAQFE